MGQRNGASVQSATHPSSYRLALNTPRTIDSTSVILSTIGVFYGPCAHSKAARKEGLPTMLAVGEFLATTATVRVPVLDGSIVDYVSCMSADDRQSTYERTNSYIYIRTCLTRNPPRNHSHHWAPAPSHVPKSLCEVQAWHIAWVSL